MGSICRGTVLCVALLAGCSGEVPPDDSGSVISSVDISASMPFSTSTTAGAVRYYRITDIAPGNLSLRYTLARTSGTGDVDMEIYTTASFKPGFFACSAGIEVADDEFCDVDPPGSEVYFKITDVSTTGTSFTLTQSAVPLTFGTYDAYYDVLDAALPWSGSVGPSSYTYIRYVAPAPVGADTPMTVTLSNLTADVDLYVTPGPGCAPTGALGVVDEICVGTILNTTDSLFLRIVDRSDTGANFNLTITP